MATGSPKPTRAGGTQASWSAAAGYQPSSRPRVLALAASALITAAIIGPLALVNGHHHHRHHHHPSMIAVRDLRMPPPHPEHRPQPVRMRTLSTRPQPVTPTPQLTAPPPMVAAAVPPVLIAPAAPATPAPVAAPAPATPTPTAAKGSDLSTSMLEAPPPVYPDDARRMKEQGTVVLFVSLGDDGRVEDVSVRQTSGSFRLDRAALKAVRRWRWSPTTVNGAAVRVAGLVTIPFILRG